MLTGAADAAGARHDAVPGMARGKPPAWQQFTDTKWPYDLPPAAGKHDRWIPAQPAVLPSAPTSGNDQRKESTPYCRASCLIEPAEPEPVRNRLIETTGVATPRLPAFSPLPATVPAPAAGGMVRSVPAAPVVAPLMDHPAPLAGQMWFIAGALLVCAMLFVPGAVVLSFFALSGFVTGGLSLAIGLTWHHQVSIFAVLGVALAVLWIRLDRARHRSDDNADPPVGGRGPHALVGRVFQLERPIEGGHGMVTFGGTSWRISGRDCAAGKQVKVLGAEGTLLIVDPVEC